MSIISEVEEEVPCLVWRCQGGLPGGGEVSTETRRRWEDWGRASRQREQHVRGSEVREDRRGVVRGW